MPASCCHLLVRHRWHRCRDDVEHQLDIQDIDLRLLKDPAQLSRYAAGRNLRQQGLEFA
jgi:hypothetical protein